MTTAYETLSADLAELAAEQSSLPSLDPDEVAGLGKVLACPPVALPAGSWEELEAKLVAADSAPKIVLSCTYCHDEFKTGASQEAAYCATCLAPHHRDCFETHTRCAGPGCLGTHWVLPSAPGSASRPAESLRDEVDVPGPSSPAPDADSPSKRKRGFRVILPLALVACGGLAAVAWSVVQPAPSQRVHSDRGTVTMVVWAHDREAGDRLTPDDVAAKGTHLSVYRSLEATESPPISESELTAYFGLSLKASVSAGDPIRRGQFPLQPTPTTSTPTPRQATQEVLVLACGVTRGTLLTREHLVLQRRPWDERWEGEDAGPIAESALPAYLGRPLLWDLPVGEVLRPSLFKGLSIRGYSTQGLIRRPVGSLQEVSVFERDVPPGAVLEAGHLTLARVRWRKTWNQPREGPIVERLDAFLSRQLKFGGRAGDPLLPWHLGYGPDPTVAVLGDEDLGLIFLEGNKDGLPEEKRSGEKRSDELLPELRRVVRPIDRAWAYLEHHGVAGEFRRDSARIWEYSPPRPPRFSWMVNFGGRYGSVDVGVTGDGGTWELDDNSSPMRPGEGEHGGYVAPDSALPARSPTRKER